MKEVRTDSVRLLTSPYIVRTYSAFPRGSLAWIEMELVDGGDLREWTVPAGDCPAAGAVEGDGVRRSVRRLAVPARHKEGRQISVEFKPFGVSIAFTPTVLDKDRIRLEVAPEFSEINNNLTTGGASTGNVKIHKS